MAESEQGGLDVSAGQPSIFEVIAQDSLASSVQPAVRHLVKYLYESNPSRFKWLWKWYDEVYALFDLVIESYYLKRYGGSLVENFYGMKRVINGTCNVASTGYPRLRSLFMLVGWPYFLKKLEKFHAALSIHPASSQRKSLVHILTKCYPWIKILFSTWALLLKFAYVLSWCNIHTPELKLANVHLEKLTPADFMFFHKTERRSWRTFAVLFSIITRCITYGLYFIQFLDFYYNSDAGDTFRTQQIQSSKKCPPAPHKRLRESSVLLMETNKCPLCLRQRSSDTVLSVSGYVFCYGCIYSFVEREKKCPVTGLPASTDSLIRLFVKAE